VILTGLVSVLVRWRQSPPGPDPGVVAGEERQLLLAPHLRARLRPLVAVGERGEAGGGPVRRRAGRDAHAGDGRGAAGAPAARGLHRSVGGVQLQLKQQHPVVGEGRGRVGRLRHLQILERLHAAPADRKRRHRLLGRVLPSDDLPGGAAGGRRVDVRQPERAGALRPSPAISEEAQTKLVSPGDAGHRPRLQTGALIQNLNIVNIFFLKLSFFGP